MDDKIFVFILVMVGLSTGFNITPVNYGILKYESGIVITNLRFEVKTIKLNFPRQREVLPTLFNTIDMPKKMRDRVNARLQRMGEKFDRHLKSTLTLWRQEISHAPIPQDEIERYWSEKRVREKKFVGIDPVSLSLATYASSVATAAAGVAAWNRVSIGKIESRMDQFEEFATKTHKMAVKVRDTVVGLAEDVRLLFNKTHETEFYQQSLLEVMLLLSDIELGLAIFESTYNDELQQLRQGRLPTQLIDDEIVSEISRDSSTGNLAMPLRLIKTSVLENNPEDLSITIQVEVPLMKTLQYYPKYKVENVGFADYDGCTLFKSTPNYIVKLPEGFRSIDSEYCNSQSSLFMLCNSGAFNSTSLNCYPTFDEFNSVLCGQTKVCGLNAIIQDTPVGYLVHFKDEVIITKDNLLLYQSRKKGGSYCIQLETTETMTVDGSSIKSDNSPTHSKLDFSIFAQKVERDKSDFDKNIQRMGEDQRKMNESITELGQLPIITKGPSWYKSLDTTQIITLALVVVIITAMIIIGICYWKKSRKDSTKKGNATHLQSVRVDQPPHVGDRLPYHDY